MRKDVRLGLAIGGLFLVIVVIGAVVASRPPRNTRKEVALDTGSGAAAGNADSTASHDPESAPSQDQETPPQPPKPGKSDKAEPTRPNESNPDTLVARNTDPSDVPAGSKKTKKVDDWDKLFASTGSGTADEVTPAGGSPAFTDPGSVVAPGRGNRGSTVRGVGAFDPPTPTSRPSQPGSGQSHTMQANETFSSIALAVYGESKYYKAIEKANPNLNPKSIRPGTVINIPDPSEVRTASASSSAKTDHAEKSTPHSDTKKARVTNPLKEYAVQSNDSLYKIATRLYGRGDKADAIYQANKDLIGPDSARLKIGMILKLPEPPALSAASR